MPYINIRLSTNPESGQRQQLFEKTTLLMNTVMGKRREVTVVHIEGSEPQQWAANGTELVSQDPVGAYVDIKVTEGTNTPEEKAEMIHQMMKVLKKVTGVMQEACYIVIDDVPGNSWGYNGVTQAARASS